ncbi:outer membrane pore protein [Escherichia coli]|nr:outer membrane pore protein [Escherichia coli]
MSGNIYTLYKSHCENVGKYRGIEISGVVSSVEISKVESRATLLTLLDLVLHEHRKKFGTPYNQLNGKKALVHLILMKHHWMPKQINEMKFDELLLSIQWICPYISRHLLSLNPLQARCRRYSRGER